MASKRQKDFEAAFESIANQLLAAGITKPQTPFDLSEKMFSQIDIKNKTILVISDIALGMSLVLHDDFDPKLTYFLVGSEIEKSIVVEFEIAAQNIIVIDHSNFHKCNIFEGMKFDVIVGNPPYNPDVKKHEGREGGTGSKNKIWHKFVEVAFRAAHSKTQILFLTPDNWRRGRLNPERKNQIKIAEDLIWKHLQWVFDTRSPKDYFDKIVGNNIQIDAWCIDLSKQCTVSGHLATFKIHPLDLASHSIFEKYLQKCYDNSEKLVFRYDWDTRECKNSPDDVYCFRLTNTSAQYDKNIYKWDRNKPKFYENPKVVFSNSGRLSPKFFEGDIGAGGHTWSYLVSNASEGENLIKFLSSNLIKFLLKKMAAPGGYSFSEDYIRQLPKDLLHKPWQEVFEFTAEELAYIEENVP